MQILIIFFFEMRVYSIITSQYEVRDSLRDFFVTYK